MKSLIDKIKSKTYIEANEIMQSVSGIVDYFCSEEEKDDFIYSWDSSRELVCEDRSVYGDWQTPIQLARAICLDHVKRFGEPDIVIEPTCGRGSFVKSALEIFHNVSEVFAVEINGDYTKELKYTILSDAIAHPRENVPKIRILNKDFFLVDLNRLSKKIFDENLNLAIIGNPPWVTNSHQGKFESDNAPKKSNIYNLNGIDAITGKSNFDISEFITLSLLEKLGKCKGGISFLLKNSVIRNIISKQQDYPKCISEISQEQIDASKEFDVSVEASCLFAKLGTAYSQKCDVSDFYNKRYISTYGWINGCFVSDINSYEKFSEYDGHSSYEWRSGIKHDCASVLELNLMDGKFVNGFGEEVDIESDLIYPLLKSSDINRKSSHQRKFIIVPQHKTGENTASLKIKCPKLYQYLESKEEFFAKRKSSIYKGKDKFSIFGVGDYSFKPFKIVVSSLYKDISFVLVEDHKGKPYVVDDTCYQLAFDSLEEARIVLSALKSDEIQFLLKSLVFKDAKRVVTKNLLMRLDIDKYLNSKNLSMTSHNESLNNRVVQLSLF